VDIGKNLAESWNLTFKHPAQFFVAGIVTVVLSAFTLGILAAPLAAGVMMMYVNARKGKPVQTGDMFRYLNRTFPLLFAAIAVGVLTGLGYLLLIVPGLIFTAWWLHVIPIIADQEISLGEAMGKSREIARQNGILLTLLFMVVCGIVGAAGSFVVFFGTFFTVPMAAGMLGLSYADGKSAIAKGGL
jgi:uncharacterized membrane protein